MRRLTALLIVPVLVSTLLFTTSCSPSASAAVSDCLQNIVLSVAANIIKGEEFTLVDSLDIARVCIPAAIAVYSDHVSSASTALVSSSYDTGSYSRDISSSSFSNCTPLSRVVRFTFTVPFAMAVGHGSAFSTFSARPSGSGSDESKVGAAVWDTYSVGSSVTTGPSGAIDVTIPAYTKGYLILPVAVNYRTGYGKVGDATLSWFYTTSFSQNGSVRYTSDRCSTGYSPTPTPTQIYIPVPAPTQTSSDASPASVQIAQKLQGDYTGCSRANGAMALSIRQNPGDSSFTGGLTQYHADGSLFYRDIISGRVTNDITIVFTAQGSNPITFSGQFDFTRYPPVIHMYGTWTQGAAHGTWDEFNNASYLCP